MKEVKDKIKKVQALLEDYELEGVRFRGVDWFSWATAGGNSVVIFTAEAGIAEVFITPTKAWILTNTIEVERLAAEEVPLEFEIMAFPWQDPEAADEFVQAKMKKATCVSDRPGPGEKPLPPEFLQMKLILTDEEVARYRLIGEAAAEAMTEALQNAEPDWTEHQLAGEGAKALWKRGLDPTLVLVGSKRRTTQYRHPIATDATLGDSAMMVFCARGCGLYANLTRFIYFKDPTEEEISNFERVALVEAAAFNASRPGKKVSDVYHEIANTYLELGCPDEINKHHQGGITGYLSREVVASPHLAEDVILENSMAMAWNPTLPGAKIEDTVLITEDDCEILTLDPLWPTMEVDGRMRPQIWVKK